MAVAMALYLPPLIWLAPTLFLLPMAFRRGHWKWLFGAVVVHLQFHMGFRWGGGGEIPPAGQRLVILSNNRGQQGNDSVKSFKAEVDPDILVFQEAKGRAAAYRKDPNYVNYPHVDEEAEFVILSRFPILSREPVGAVSEPPALRQWLPLAVRFEIDFNGQRVAVYAVHLMTPRHELLSYRRGAFLYGILGVPGTPFNAKRLKVQAFWDARKRDAEELLQRMKQEKIPTIAAGDFNMIDRGVIYHHFAAEFQDAHRTAGDGYGFTVPGVTHNPAALFDPWMRLDYVWTSQHWEISKFSTEKDRPSQHRAISAWLRLKS